MKAFVEVNGGTFYSVAGPNINVKFADGSVKRRGSAVWGFRDAGEIERPATPTEAELLDRYLAANFMATG